MTNSESDIEFIDWLETVDHMPQAARERLFALARRGAAIERLRIENIQMQAALGYAICAEDERHIIPENPFKCGVCDARMRAWREPA